MTNDSALNSLAPELPIGARESAGMMSS